MRISDWSSDVCSSDLDVEIGVGVEAVGEGEPLIAQIGFDLEIGVEAEGLGLAPLQAAAEFLGQPRFGKIGDVRRHARDREPLRSEEHTSELQSLMRISYAVFCLKNKKIENTQKK